MYIVKLKDEHYHLIFDMANISSECIRAASFRTCEKKKTSYQKTIRRYIKSDTVSFSRS